MFDTEEIPMRKENRIVITGIGALTAGGNGKNEVWDAIVNRRTGLVRKEYKLEDANVGKFYLHEIKNFNINDYDINRQVLNEIKTWKKGEEILDLYYFMAVIRMALDDSTLGITTKNKHMVGLMLAHENIGHGHFYWKIINEMSFTEKDISKRPTTKKKFLDEFYKKFHRTGYELQSFMSLHHIAKVFDIHGFSLLLNNACASGLFAIESAADAIRSGKCKQMVVAVVDHSDIFKQMWFRDTSMCAKDGRIKPFAADRDGFTLGDGGAALVLENMDSAIKRKAEIYAEYLGGSFALEGWKVTYPDITNDLYKNMIMNAAKFAKVKISDIDLVVPHGVGTKITDAYEAKAICEVFREENRKPVITALKPFIGHTLGSAALLETAIMLIGLKNRKIPPTLNCENVDTKLGIEILKKMKNTENVKIMMKTACGFAGYDAACIFRLI